MKKQTNPSCWNCRQKIFKPKGDKDVGAPFCKAKNDWFPQDFDYGKEHSCKFYE